MEGYLVGGLLASPKKSHKKHKVYKKRITPELRPDANVYIPIETCKCCAINKIFVLYIPCMCKVHCYSCSSLVNTDCVGCGRKIKDRCVGYNEMYKLSY